MDSIVMIMRNVIADHTAQMNFIENYHVVEEIQAAVSNPVLASSILPGKSAMMGSHPMRM
jgi:hypothetical protein